MQISYWNNLKSVMQCLAPHNPLTKTMHKACQINMPHILNNILGQNDPGTDLMRTNIVHKSTKTKPMEL